MLFPKYKLYNNLKMYELKNILTYKVQFYIQFQNNTILAKQYQQILLKHIFDIYKRSKHVSCLNNKNLAYKINFTFKIQTHNVLKIMLANIII